MQLSDEFFEHLKELKALTGLEVSHSLDAEDVLATDGRAAGRLYIVTTSVALPPGVFKVQTTQVLFLGDYQYPDSSLDMFWTDLDVIRVDGTIPQNADLIEVYLDRKWRRFSWHRNGTWDPARNGLLDHYEFMLARIAEEAKK